MILNFLSSIPRSGSTLLSSLLNQRSDTYVSPTSSLGEVTSSSWNTLSKINSSNMAAHIHFETAEDMLTSNISNHYRHKNEKFIFDKGRFWHNSNQIRLMRQLQRKVKIVATVRPIVECIASYVRLVNPKDVGEFCSSNILITQLLSVYNSLKLGYDEYPTSILLIEYDNLIENPLNELRKIEKFVDMPKFDDYDFYNVENMIEEDDSKWGIEGLHDLRPVVGKIDHISDREVLGEDIFNGFSAFNEFWIKKPKAVFISEQEKDPLDIQLETALQGDIEKAESMNKNLLIKRPDCPRVRFNSGWFSMYREKIQEGHENLDVGRTLNVYGDPHIRSHQPIWNGQSNSTVLLNLEGGFGDQIHGYRFAEDIAKRNNKVVISCSPELGCLFSEKFIVVEHDAALSVFHDYWVPSMSAIRPLGYELDDIVGTPYINRVADSIPGKIGIKWSGNPKFAHEQHRLFPENLMFDAVRDFDCISLQKEEGSELKPYWMSSAKMDTWNDTRKAISECELVISSCTGLAHLSASMGVETWIVIPILPYYLWAIPGNKTPYYDSVTLFRQEKYGDWKAPFDKIKFALNKRQMKYAA